MPLAPATKLAGVIVALEIAPAVIVTTGTVEQIRSNVLVRDVYLGYEI